MKTTALVIAACLALSACAGMKPDTSAIAKAPRVEFGQPLPSGNDYVIHYPAGVPLPVSTVVDGNLFAQPGKSRTQVVLKHDIYGYHQFASLDGQHWLPAHKLINTRLTVEVSPKDDSSAAGLLHLQMDEK